jgi:preprotein translocase subunit YajC
LNITAIKNKEEELKRSRLLILGLLVGALVGLLFVASCTTGTDGTTATGFDPTIIIFLVLIFAAMYFLMIRPQRKRQKEHEQLTEDLKRGDSVVTAGGIYGTIESISEDSIVLKIESGSIRIARGSVVSKRVR